MNVILEAAESNRCLVVKWPRLIYLLPILQHYFPSSKFIQVIRDGRDIQMKTNDISIDPIRYGFF